MIDIFWPPPTLRVCMQGKRLGREVNSVPADSSSSSPFFFVLKNTLSVGNGSESLASLAQLLIFCLKLSTQELTSICIYLFVHGTMKGEGGKLSARDSIEETSVINASTITFQCDNSRTVGPIGPHNFLTQIL